MTDTNEEDEDQGIGALDVKGHLEEAFPRGTLTTPRAASSFHCEVTFFEYDIRVILSGARAPDRPIHYRFMQRVVMDPIKNPNRSVKRIIQEETLYSREDFLKVLKPDQGVPQRYHFCYHQSHERAPCTKHGQCGRPSS